MAKLPPDETTALQRRLTTSRDGKLIFRNPKRSVATEPLNRGTVRLEIPAAPKSGKENRRSRYRNGIQND
jgi:hypothetical protein